MTPFRAWERQHFRTARDTARALRVGEEHVRKLRAGLRQPSGPMLALMDLIDRHPDEARSPDPSRNRRQGP